MIHMTYNYAAMFPYYYYAAMFPYYYLTGDVALVLSREEFLQRLVAHLLYTSHLPCSMPNT